MGYVPKKYSKKSGARSRSSGKKKIKFPIQQCSLNMIYVRSMICAA
jgi:hypothetical protein